MLAVADYADDRNPNSGQFRRNLAQQTGEIGAGRRQQGAGQQDQSGQALADHPQHLVTNIRLKAVDRQDRPALALQGLAMRRRPGRGGDQLVVALEQVGHAAFADCHAAPTQLPVDLRDAAVLAIAQGADQRDHVQPELVLRQRQGGFRLRPPRLMIASTASILAAPDLQAQANQAPQRHDRPTVAVADPYRPAALRTGRPERNQDLLVRRLHTAPTAGHLQLPLLDPPDTLNRQPVLPFLKKTTVAKPAVGRRAVQGRRGRRRDSGGSGTLAWWRCFKRARVSRHLTRSTAARSWALIGAMRVSVAARTRTEPRTTRLGEATLRPVVRRSWWRWAPKNCSRSLLVADRPGTRR